MRALRSLLLLWAALLGGCAGDASSAKGDPADHGAPPLADAGLRDDGGGRADGAVDRGSDRSGDARAPAADAAPFVPLPGVHAPLAIAPAVEIPDNHWLLDVYRTVLGREHDAAGYRVNRAVLEQGTSRAQLFAALVASAEFKGDPALADRAGFVTRLYQTLLKRSPSASEVAGQLAQLREADGSGSGLTWPELIAGFYAAAEYRAKNCHDGYYTLGAQVRPGALLLADLFAGRARLQTIAESEGVQLTVPSAKSLWDQKLPILDAPSGAGYLAFTRALVVASPPSFNVVLLRSADGVTFTEVGPLFSRTGNQTFYDPHVAIDSSVCPRRYVMAVECLGHEGAASLCTAQSTTPGWAETWSAPTILVDGCTGNAAGICKTAAAESASTGTLLVDGKARYVGWTQVYDGVGASDPQAHTYSQAAALGSFASYFGTVMQGSSPIHTMMSALPQPWCTSAWDCNNRDVQDWKREGSRYYALYNGANYYRCDGSWGVSVARSGTPVGAEYSDRLPLARGIRAERSDTCGISYPVLNVLGGELFVYYAYYPKSGGNRTMRARLVPTP